MDSNWIFDNTHSTQASTPTAQQLNPHQPSSVPSSIHNENNYTPSQSHPFLNFDSPSNHSDSATSHSQLNTSLNGTTGINVVNSNTDSNAHNHFNTQINQINAINGDSNHHTPSAESDNLHEWAQLPDFNDLDMNFFQNEHHQPSNANTTNHQTQQQHQQNNIMMNGHHSISPTPQSFDVTTYTNSSNSSFIQNFQSPQLDSQSNGGNSTATTSIRPDVVFTPLVSPAVTPLESMINKNQQHNGANGNSNFFSPLTSPALEAKSPMKMRKSSTSTSPDESNGSTTTTKKKYKRKTPGNTPIVGPTIPGRIAKQSPIIKAKRSSSYVNSIQHHHQQQSQSSGQPQQQQQLSTATTPSSGDYTDMTPLPDPSVESKNMAPPPSKSLQRNRSIKKDSNQPATPATLMNFKLESSSSPVILPSNDRKPSLSSQNHASYQQHSLPSQTGNNGNGTNANHQRRPSEDSDTKKASHKLAEQGRRNRMNQAIMELGELIPDELQATVSIPSKATTVELATKYILDLKDEVRRLREGMESDESVSPLETK